MIGRVALMLFALAFAPIPSLASSSPPYFALICNGVVETAGSVSVEIDKNAKATSYSKLTVTTSDGTAKAGVDYVALNQTVTVGNNTLKTLVPIAIIARPGYQGSRYFAVHLKVVRNGVAVVADGTVVIADSEQPPAPTPTPTPTNSWVSAPLQDGGFARVKANDSEWDMTGPGRKLVPGEIVAVYFNGWGSEADGSASFAIYALSDGTSGRAKAADLEGVAPVGSPPGLPADWWVPGLVTANKTCTDPRQGHEGQPGVGQGGVYRAAMLVGSHMKLAAGMTGDASNMWLVFASGVQQYTTGAVVVTGDCLTGQ